MQTAKTWRREKIRGKFEGNTMKSMHTMGKGCPQTAKCCPIFLHLCSISEGNQLWNSHTRKRVAGWLLQKSYQELKNKPFNSPGRLWISAEDLLAQGGGFFTNYWGELQEENTREVGKNRQATGTWKYCFDMVEKNPKPSRRKNKKLKSRTIKRDSTDMTIPKELLGKTLPSAE